MHPYQKSCDTISDCLSTWQLRNLGCNKFQVCSKNKIQIRVWERQIKTKTFCVEQKWCLNQEPNVSMWKFGVLLVNSLNHAWENWNNLRISNPSEASDKTTFPTSTETITPALMRLSEITEDKLFLWAIHLKVIFQIFFCK